MFAVAPRSAHRRRPRSHALRDSRGFGQHIETMDTDGVPSSADRPPPPESTASTAADLVNNDSSANSERAGGPFSEQNTITGYRRPQAR
jgi:hypothetical protein